jgi:hypothetical protein
VYQLGSEDCRLGDQIGVAKFGITPVEGNFLGLIGGRGQESANEIHRGKFMARIRPDATQQWRL